METQTIKTEVRVYSQSALHSLITGPESTAPKAKSKVDPYRKRPGLFSFLGLKDVIEEIKREESEVQDTQIAAKEREVNWNLATVSEA